MQVSTNVDGELDLKSWINVVREELLDLIITDGLQDDRDA